MKLETKPYKASKGDSHKVKYKTKWLTFGEMCSHPDFIEKELDPSTVYYRHKNGAKTIETLMRRTRKYTKPKSREEDEIRGPNVSDELWHAMKFGSNEDILRCS